MLLTVGLSAIVCASMALAAGNTKTVVHHTVPTRWQAQDLKGTISMVDPQQDLVVVRDSSGTPFDIQVQRSTHITNGQSPATLAQLSKNESVSIRYIPETRGDIARQIQVQR